METVPDTTPIKIESLSVREREVLDLAVEGLTDEQIAQSLAIMPSTVSSYWVRIRGKLGFISRTEIVAMVLRHESKLRYADLIAENARLVQSEKKAQTDLARARADLRAAGNDVWAMLALSHAADAMLVCDGEGTVVFANLQAERLLASEPNEMEGTRVWDLSVPELDGSKLTEATDVLRIDGPPRLVLGIESAFYAKLCDGSNFRAVIVAERFIGNDGPMAVLMLREFLGEVDDVLRVLRKPFEMR